MPAQSRYRFHEPHLRSIITAAVEDGIKRAGGLPPPPTTQSLAVDSGSLESCGSTQLPLPFTNEAINLALVRSGVFSFTDWLQSKDGTAEWLKKLLGLCVTRAHGWQKPKDTPQLLAPSIRTQEDQAVSFLGDWVSTDLRWREKDRPFYNVYPLIFDALKSIRLDVDWGQIVLPEDRTLLVKFPKGHEPHGLAAILFCEYRLHADMTPGSIERTSRQAGVNVGSRNIHFNFFFANEDDLLARMMESSFALALPSGSLTVEESLSRDDCLCGPVRSLQLPQYKAIRDFALRLLGFISLVGQDPQVVTPLVLTKDIDRYDALTDEAARQMLVLRAQRTNGRGFDFGGLLQQQHDDSHADSTRTVHYRKPHWTLVWTGTGRTIPKIVMRKGAWVNTEELFGVPTGYLGNESQQELEAILSTTPGTSEAVYLIREEGKPRVKIGRTDTDVRSRLKGLQTGNSDRLIVVGYIRTGNARRMEADLHRELATKRLTGEWFYLSPEECAQLIMARGGVLCDIDASRGTSDTRDQPHP